MAKDSGRVTERLAPHQLAVGKKAGVETIVHSDRKWIDDHKSDPTMVFMKRDKKIAFNAANPAEVLTTCAEYMPDGTAVNLVYRGGVEKSYRGQQGCPAMSPMYCLMQKQHTEEAKQLAPGPCFEPEFADDWYLGGDPSLLGLSPK